MEISGSYLATIPKFVELVVQQLPPEKSLQAAQIAVVRGLIRVMEALFLVCGIPRSAGKLETHVPFITLSGRSRW